MNAAELVAALNLPDSARVGQRVPKKLLLESGAATAADKRRLQEGIEELFWLAALKPTTIGVSEYRDTAREVLEIAVLRLDLRAEAKAARLVELVHRAVPYPVLLITEQAGKVDLSAALKRWAHNEPGKVVLDGEIVAAEWDTVRDAKHASALCAALSLDHQPRLNLHVLYQGWIDILLALRAARITGEFRLAADPAQAAARREALRDCARLDVEIARLRAAAAKEKQLARLVELNLELKRKQMELTAARERL